MSRPATPVEKLKTIWFRLIESLWLVPALITLAGAALAILLVRFNDAMLSALGGAQVSWIFGGTAGGARSVLESISGSIITVTGVVFSVTIVALQLASSQFTPRVLRRFMADRANQVVLGVFIGTFTFTLLVQRTVRSEAAGEAFVPQVAVTAAVLLALTSIGFLIFFINHVARSMQASVIVDSVAESALRVLRAVYPEERTAGSGHAGSSPTTDELTAGRDGPPAEIRARRAGYVQAFERARLRHLTVEHDLQVVFDGAIGSYLLPGTVVMRAWPAERIDDEMRRELAETLVLGPEPTAHQDVKHGLVELMDIALKGLSPGINDPTTAVNALERMAQVWLELSWRSDKVSVDRDGHGKVRVVVRRPELEELVELPFTQLRHFGAGNASFAITSMTIMAQLASLAPPEARPVFLRQMEAVISTALQQTRTSEDRRRIELGAERARRTAAEDGGRAAPFSSPPPLRARRARRARSGTTR